MDLTSRFVSLLAASLALLVLPATARAEEPPMPSPALRVPLIDGDCNGSTPLPSDLRCAKRSAYVDLFVVGGVIAGLGDALDLVTMLGNGGRDPVAILPVVGPFIAAATHRTPPPPPGCELLCGLDLSMPTYIAAGALQAVGAGLLLTTLAVRKSHVVPRSTATVVPVPMVGPGGSGLGLVGTF